MDQGQVRPSSDFVELPLLGRRFLVADDSRPMRIFTMRLLELAGGKVVGCEDGLDAVRLGQQELFDALLIDVEMPRLNGCDAAKILRSSGLKSPMVAVTGHSEADELERCYRHGFDSCLIKPFAKPDLVGLLQRLLVGQ